MGEVSRRSVILRGLAFAATASAGSLASIVPFTAASAAITQPISYPGPYLQIKSAVSSGAELDALFPGIEGASSYQTLKDLCYLITNVSPKIIRALSLSWTVNTEQSESIHTSLYYFRPRGIQKRSMHWGQVGNKTRVTGKVALLMPGSTRLISPFFSFTPSYFEAKGREKLAAIVQGASRSSFPVSAQQYQSTLYRITMQPDAIVTDTGDVVGPDVANLGKIIRVTRNAEHDEARAIWQLLETGADRAAVKKALRRDASGLFSDITPSLDLYYRVRQREAKVLLRRLRHARWEQFNTTIKVIKSEPKTITRSVSALL